MVSKSPLFPKTLLEEEKGAALLTTLLLLMLMSLSGFMLLQFATLDIRLSGNDRLSRALLYRVESCALYGAHTLLNMDKELLSPGNPKKPSWIHDAKEILEDTDLGFTGKKDLSALSDKEFLQLMSWMAEKDFSSTKDEMISLDDEELFPFLEGGRGKIFVVDCGQASAGSQDLGSSTLRNYLIFTEYRDANGLVRFLEMGLRKKL